MSNISNELFLLIANLSQQRNKENIISFFIQGLNSHLEGGNLKWINKPRNEAQIVVCTKNKIYGEVSYSKDFFENNTINLALVQNGAQMLAVIIERLEQEELLNNEKSLLEKLVEERTIELKESEGKYRSLIDDVLDTSLVGTFILDSEFKVAWINSATEKYFGIKREDVIGKDKQQLINSKIKMIFEDPKYFAKKVLDTYDNNNYIENFECHIIQGKDREERWLSHWSQPITDGLYKNGRIEQYTDITERKKAEKALKEHREHLEELVGERTVELEEKNEELDNTLKVFVGREYKINELQEKVRELEKNQL